MRRVNITGNSQVGALSFGLQQIGETPGFDIRVFGMGSGGHEKVKFSFREGNEVFFHVEEHRERFLRATELAHIPNDGTVWGICKAFHNARVYRSDMWRSFEPSGFPVGLDQIISEGALTRIIERDFRHVRNFMTQLKEAGIECFAISAPHPRANHSCILDGTEKELVGYIDRRYRNHVMEHFEREGIDVVTPPPETYDEDGFLKEQYWNTRPGDSHHANADYGRLMMERVIAYLNRRFGATNEAAGAAQLTAVND